YTVVEGSWRYIHYFDGSEELYNLASDPNQYRNLVKDGTHKAKLTAMRKHMPENPALAYTARYKNFKAVFHSDESRSPLLYDLTDGKGITDTGDIAADKPKILERVRDYVRKSGIRKRHFEVPAE
ncbi:MAG: hypothetical protein GY953_30610, partial [bacterium]|nr:hypothetical protein [bacterium]